MSSALTSFSNLSKAFYACSKPGVETARLHVAGEKFNESILYHKLDCCGHTRREDEELVRFSRIFQDDPITWARGFIYLSRLCLFEDTRMYNLKLCWFTRSG
jgi:hypothetical protein